MKLTINREKWPLRNVFRISRREATDTEVLTVTLEDNGAMGRGEAGPIARYGESAERCAAELENLRTEIESGVDRMAVQKMLPAGSARNALDCALWDFEAKMKGERVWRLMGWAEPTPVITAFTLSINSPDEMLAATKAVSDRPMLKVKLAGDSDDLARLRAVRTAAPDTELIVDANEALTIDGLDNMMADLVALRVGMIEQPLPEGADDALLDYDCPVPICADESCHTRTGLKELIGKYQVINIKFDKTGGLTEALVLAEEARALGFEIMVGCMLGTSLAMAPAMLVAQGAAFVDLDGPLLLARDRQPGLVYKDGLVYPPTADVWG